MSLAKAIASPFDGVKFVPGFAGTYPNVLIGGVSQPAAWSDGVYAAPGESVIIGQIVKPDAPAQNVVVARVGHAGPREATVTAAPGGSDTITVTDANSVNYTVTFLSSYTPTNGDRVRLLWQGRDGTVLNKVGITPGQSGDPVLNRGTTAPPAPANSGTFNGVATDSGTWTPAFNAWDHWSLAGGRVFQGSYGGTTNNGAWFYNGVFAELAGATINRVLLRVPQRLSVGSYNSALALNIYAHTSPSKPGGDVVRTAGPFTVTIPAGWSGDWVDITAAGFAPTLIAGGGIGIAGDPYMAFNGKPQDPASGQIKMDWSR